MCLRFGPQVKNWAMVYGNCYPKGLVKNFLVMITVSNPHNPFKKTDIFRKTQLQSTVAAFLWLHSSRSISRTGKYLAAHHQVLGCSPPNALTQPQYAVSLLHFLNVANLKHFSGCSLNP